MSECIGQEGLPVATEEPRAIAVPFTASQKLTSFLKRPRLAVWVIVLGVGLTAPSVFTGFQLDDQIGRFIFSDAPGAQRLYRIYAGGYGAANGKPEDAAWMLEQGYAPWWIDPHVLVAFWRPISLSTHLLDAKLWPDNPFLWHAHSLLWFALLLFAAVRMFQGIQGPLIGGLAALLFALDHTHALAVGFSTNRYILIATALCMFVLHAHHRYRSAGSVWARWIGPLVYALALLSGESSAAIVGYLLSYALFVDTGKWRERVFSVVPYFVVTIGWRMVYNALGRGARGSDLYIDPAREPLSFAAAVFERGPMLLLGQWFMPPAETYTLVEAPLTYALIAFAWIFLAVFVFAVWQLVRRDKIARFWAAGMLLAFVPMCAGEPNNRMLFVAGIGAAGLLAQWSQVAAQEFVGAARSFGVTFSRRFGAFMLFCHLLLSPLLVPVNACSLITLDAINRSFADVGPEAVGREAVFVTSPDYFATRLVHMNKEVEHLPMPQRWRTLAYGPEQVTVHRADARTLLLDYEGGAMSKPAVTKQVLDLYRSRKSPMSKGERVALEGLSIEVLEVTPDGRPLRVRFEFADSLDSARYYFYHWVDNGFRALELPQIGTSRVLPLAIITPEVPFL
jgi:hypothetical protein